jgi:predicted nucleotidyltransferase
MARIEGRGVTLDDLRARRREILEVAARHGAQNVRVFGSVARGEADAASDVDLLVDMVTEARGFRYFGVVEDLRRDLEALLGREVDIMDSAALNRWRNRVLGEAVSL